MRNQDGLRYVAAGVGSGGDVPGVSWLSIVYRNSLKSRQPFGSWLRTPNQRPTSETGTGPRRPAAAPQALSFSEDDCTGCQKAAALLGSGGDRRQVVCRKRSVSRARP